jgi:hypothetical protein
MNAPFKLTRAAMRVPKRKALLPLAVTLAGLGGCADLHRAVTLPPVNPESPVAGVVREGAPKSYPRPRLADVPPAPKNVTPAPLVKAQVIGLVRCRRSILSYGPAHPRLTSGAETYAVNERAAAMPDPNDIPPADQAALSESLAERLRAFAAPPAAIGSGPAPTPADASPPGPTPPSRSPIRRAAAVPAAPPLPAPVAAPLGPSRVQVAAPGEMAPPLPAPQSDPLLARCT